MYTMSLLKANDGVRTLSHPPVTLSHNLVYQRSFVNFPRLRHHNSLLIIKATSKDHQEETSSSTTPAKNSSSAWKWMIGILLSAILPSLRGKATPFDILRNKVNKTLETVESVAEVVEELAEDVEKVSEDVADKLPEDSKLKEAVESVGTLAEQLGNQADRAQQIIHNVEEEIESSVEDLFHVRSDSDQKKNE